MLIITGIINRRKMKKILFFTVAAVILSLFTSCGKRSTGDNEEIVVPRASVTTTQITEGNISELLPLNGKTVFLKKNEVISPISGYITAIHIKFGDQVKKGDVLFEIQTREDKALEQSQMGDSIGFQNFGRISVTATTSGMVNKPLTLGAGAYVVEGSTLCTLADTKDLLVRVNVPYEYHRLVKEGIDCRLYLPDNSQVEGTVYQVQPYIDETSQTQEILVKPEGIHAWPENMNLIVSFLKADSKETLLLPKKALLTNETQTDYWVMKIVRDSMALKVPVKTGIKNDSIVEIISDQLKAGDNIILEGGYGLPDSSIVKIEK